VGGSTAEVALGAVTVDSLVQAADGGLRVVFAIGLESVGVDICCVVGLVQVVDENLSGLLECFSGLDTYRFNSRQPYIASS
jgi:hypothetical protein